MSKLGLAAGAVIASIVPACFIISMVQAQTARSPQVMRGAVIAAQGTKAGAPACAQCHAFNGASDSSGAFPRLAGQPSMYLQKQLSDFSSGERLSAMMSPIAKALSLDDMADVAAYYAASDAPFPPLLPADPELVQRGKVLAMIGSAAQQIQNCNNCHGPGGSGEPPAIPYLAGQYAHYTAFTLQMWKQGYRKNAGNTMAIVAKKLTDADIAAVAAYYQSVTGGTEPGPIPAKE